MNFFCKNSVEPLPYLSLHFMDGYKHGEGVNGSCQDVTVGTSRLVCLRKFVERVLLLEYLCIISLNAMSIDYFGPKIFKDIEGKMYTLKKIFIYPFIY